MLLNFSSFLKACVTLFIIIIINYMFKLHSISGRIALGVITGLIIGFLFSLTMPLYNIPIVSKFSAGTILLFMLMGFTLGLVGVFDRHPLFGFKLNWVNRGIAAGFMFTLVYILVGYDTLELIMQANLERFSFLPRWINSPFWMLIDGSIIGLIISYIETRFAKEGSSLPLR